MVEKKSSSAEETMRLGAALAQQAQPDDVIVLSGDLGAGKTQFSKGFATGLGVGDAITSPTFNILIEYEGGRLPLFHFDLYRLEAAEELDDVDFFGCIESGGVSLVEWGDKFADEMPDEYLDVRILVCDDGTRRLVAAGKGAAGTRLEESFSRC